MYGVLRLLLLLLVAAVAVGVTSGAQRHKRFVAFGKGSTFAYRLNYKVPLFKNNTILYQASGFKAAWQLPEKSDNYKLQKPQPPRSRRRWSNSGGYRRRIGSRDIRDTMHDLYESHGFDGKSCLAKSLCQSLELVERKDGVMGKIAHLLFGQSLADSLVCGNYASTDEADRCPLSLIGFKPIHAGSEL
ncbi:uncharacterized protein LOC106653635 [Trichogramma pretiosum]|uniref:uncharacterized protein LOC106653635 n=1 Tax=Trichogramma pretiosum TaxID=7493 RepID=UPI0006C9950E|nr:uncharacterized protein LOC106653635 [Trichogramma pretiosum]